MEKHFDMKDIDVQDNITQTTSEILTQEALKFIGILQRRFNKTRLDLLERRKTIQKRLDEGEDFNFLPETDNIRNGDWQIAQIPADLQDRRVEITGPVDRKMVINALNSGAKTFMADFEDSHAPTWEGTIQGQINLRDAIRRTIEFTSPQGKAYRLKDEIATLIVRPRGWHLNEKHVLVDEEPISAGIFDFGLYLFHNAKYLIEKGSGPYFYLPKLESYPEARLWNDIFVFAQDYLDIPQGTIKATVLIETLPAAFQMDEIIYELRNHMAGLNCGRWDYIFSFIKRLQKRPSYLFPDRAQITMTRHCMHSYSLLAIKTCHRRGAHAIGGMAAQIPIKDDPQGNAEALAKVRADKIREVKDGHDGTWVAHPGLVPVAMEVFNEYMPEANQIAKQREDVQITADDLLKLPQGTITEEGLRANIRVGIQYIAAWLNGNGCVPLNNLMEDAATAEISRTQVWQWVHHPETFLKDGRAIDFSLFNRILAEELADIKADVGSEHFVADKYESAGTFFDEMIQNNTLEEFLTLKAYQYYE